MENEDLCKQCENYWQDFPLPLDKVISHCSILDKKSIGEDLDDIVEYPCLKCPFDSFVKIKRKWKLKFITLLLKLLLF